MFSTKRLEDVELFLDNEEAPIDLLTVRDPNRNTVIHHCSYLNQHRHIELYLKYYRRNLENEGFTLSEIKSKTKILLDSKNAEGLAAAHYAAFKGNITVLKSLQKYEADLWLTSDMGMNLLHFAAQGDKANTVLYLHDKDFAINSKDSKGSTPLHWACFSGSEKIVEYLLAQPSVLVDEVDLDGHTPLHIAVAYGYSKIVKRLLLGGANRRVRNLKGETALRIAEENEFDKIARMLDDRYSLLDYLKFLCNAKARYEPRKPSYWQPLLFYCLALLLAALAFGPIDLPIPALFYCQAGVFLVTVGLFSSLIVGVRPQARAQSYQYFAEREEVGRVCMECVRAQQGREFHCPVCRRCVAQYDHHCFWINNCVGKHNIFRFNLFLLLAELSLLWLAALAASLLAALQAGSRQAGVLVVREWVFALQVELPLSIACGVLLVLVLVLGVPLFCLILVQQKNLLLGRTSYERFSKSSESVLTRDEGEFLGRGWEGGRRASLGNCVAMCGEEEGEEKGSESNSTSSSFVREH